MSAASLPSVLTESDNFKSVSEQKTQSLLSRLARLWAFVESAEQNLLSDDELDWRAFLEDIDLDLSVLQAAPTETDSTLTSWIVHWSWTFEANPAAMLQSLGSETKSALDVNPPVIGEVAAEIKGWLIDRVGALKMIKHGLLSAPTYDSAIAHLIAVDIVLSGMQLGLWRAQLNPQMPPRR